MSPSAVQPTEPLTNGIPTTKQPQPQTQTHPAMNGTTTTTTTTATITEPTPDYDPTLFDPIPDCITSFAAGHFLVVLDSPHRENEADLIIAAQHITPSQMSFMIRHTSGIICTPLSPTICDTLSLPQMIPLAVSGDPNRTAYTVSVDSNHHTITTGISAYDRALTCNELARTTAQPTDFRRPGHVFPLRARPGGVRVRTGHTEAAVELCRLSGLREAGVISEIVEPGVEVPGVAEVAEGESMLRRDGAVAFARKWGLKVCTVEGIREYVVANEGMWIGKEEAESVV